MKTDAFDDAIADAKDAAVTGWGSSGLRPANFPRPLKIFPPKFARSPTKIQRAKAGRQVAELDLPLTILPSVLPREALIAHCILIPTRISIGNGAAIPLCGPVTNLYF